MSTRSIDRFAGHLAPFVTLAALLCTPLAGCEPADDGGDPADIGPVGDGGEGEGEGEGERINIAGDYVDSYDIPHQIAADWTQGIDDTSSTTALTSVDNASGYAIGQNTANHPFAADKWSRYDWTFVDGRLWYCQPAFDADTAADAESAPAPDPAEPAIGGCGGFPWTGLTPATAPAVLGGWVDDFETGHTVTESGWTVGAGEAASRYIFTAVGAGWAVAFNDVDNAFGAGLWSRFDWVTVDGATYMCQSAYDAPDAATARAASADPSAPPEGGCGGMFPWSLLNPSE